LPAPLTIVVFSLSIENGKLIPIDLKVGDRVLFGKWSSTEVKLDGEELLIMKESDTSPRYARQKWDWVR
jgi:co-chaperonin GroES (HSP10)